MHKRDTPLTEFIDVPGVLAFAKDCILPRPSLHECKVRCAQNDEIALSGVILQMRCCKAAIAYGNYSSTLHGNNCGHTKCYPTKRSGKPETGNPVRPVYDGRSTTIIGYGFQSLLRHTLSSRGERCALKRTVHKSDFRKYKGLITRFPDTWMCETGTVELRCQNPTR